MATRHIAACGLRLLQCTAPAATIVNKQASLMTLAAATATYGCRALTTTRWQADDKSLGDMAKDAYNKAAHVVQDAVNQAKHAASEVGHKVQETLHAVEANAEQLMHQTSDKAQGLQHDAQAQYYDAKAETRSTADSLAGSAKNAYEEAKERVQDTYDSAKATANDMAQSAKHRVEGAVDSAQDAYDQAKGEVKGAYQEAKGQTEGAVEGAKETARGTASNVEGSAAYMSDKAPGFVEEKINQYAADDAAIRAGPGGASGALESDNGPPPHPTGPGNAGKPSMPPLRDAVDTAADVSERAQEYEGQPTAAAKSPGLAGNVGTPGPMINDTPADKLPEDSPKDDPRTNLNPY